MTQNILLVFGSLMSKVIIVFFVCMGSVATAEYLKTNYSTNFQVFFVVSILFWLLLGAIYEYNNEYNKFKTKKVN